MLLFVRRRNYLEDRNIACTIMNLVSCFNENDDDDDGDKKDFDENDI